MLSELDIKISEEAKAGRTPTVLNKVLTPRRLRECLERGLRIGRGVTSDVYFSASMLSTVEQNGLQEMIGRRVSPHLVVKVAKEYRGEPSNLYLFRRETYMASRPEIQPFAVAYSSVMFDPETGRPAIIEEMASGIDVTDKTEVSEKIDETHVDRIGYQLALVFQAFRDWGAAPEDVGKNFDYLIDASPPRILLYDLSYFKESNARTVRGDNRDFVENLRMYLIKNLNPNVSSEKLVHRAWLLKMMERIEGDAKYSHSLARLADRLAFISEDVHGYDFAKEYKQITGRDPVR